MVRLDRLTSQEWQVRLLPLRYLGPARLGACNAGYLDTRKLEALVINELRTRILIPKNLQALVILFNEEMNEVTQEQQQRLGDIDREFSDVAGRLERLFDVLETGALSLEDLGPRIQPLRHREEQLQAAKEEIGRSVTRPDVVADQAAVTSCGEDLREALSQGPLAERAKFIKSFVHKVLVHGKEPTVRYTCPLPLDELEGQSPTFLDSIHCGGGEGNRTLGPLHAKQVLSR